MAKNKSKSYNELDPELEAYMTDRERKYGLPAGLIKPVAYTESTFNPNAYNAKAGAEGLMQFIPSTAKQYNVNVKDPYSSIDGAARMFRDLLKRNGGDVNKALAGYNWGQGNLEKQGYDNMPTETRNYISQITSRMNNSSNTQIAGLQQDYVAPQQAQGLNMAAFDTSDFENTVGTGMPAPTGTQAQQMVDQSANQGFDTSAFDTSDFERTVGTGMPAPNPEAVQQPQAVQQTPQTPQTPVGESGLNNYDAVKSSVTVPTQDNGLNYYNQVVNPQSVKPTQSDAKDAEIFNRFLNDKSGTDYYLSLNDNDKQIVRRSLENYVKDHPEELEGRSGVADKLKQFAVGFMGGANNLVNEVVRGAGYITGNKDIEEYGLKNLRTQEAIDELYNIVDPNNKYSRLTGNVTGNIVATLPAPQIKLAQGAKAISALAKTGKIAKAGEAFAQNIGKAGNVVNAVASGAGYGALLTPSTASHENYAQEKAEQALTGALVAPIAQKVVGSVTRGAENLYNRFARPVSQDIADNIAAQQRLGIQPLAGDNPNVPAGVTRSQNNLIRTDDEFNQLARSNANQLTKEANSVTNQYSTFDRNAFLNHFSDLSQEAAAGGPQAKLSQDIIDRASKVDANDYNEIFKLGAAAEMTSRKISAGAKYDNVNAIAELLDDGTAKALPLTRNSIQGLQAEAAASASKSSPANEVLDKLKNDLKFDLNGELTIKEVNAVDKTIKNYARNEMDPEKRRLYNDLASSLRNDKDTILSNADIDTQKYQQALNEANQYYARNVARYKADKEVSKIFNLKDNKGNEISSDKIIDNLIKTGQVDKIKKVYEILPDASKDAVAAGFFSKAIADSLDSNGIVRPSSLNTRLTKYRDPNSGDPLAVVFGNNQKVRDLIKATSNMTSYSAAKADVVNGSKVYDAITKNAPLLAGLLGGGAAGYYTGSPELAMLGLTAGAGRAAWSKIMAQALKDSSKRSSQIILNFNKADPRSKNYNKYLEDFTKLIGNYSNNIVWGDTENLADPQNFGIIKGQN